MQGNDLLKSLIRKQKFVILDVQDESTPATADKPAVPHYVITVEEDVTAKGSIPLPNGGAMKVTGNEIHVAGDDVAVFTEGLKKEGDKTIYEGSLKLDVSKPQFRTVNGQSVVAKEARIWLRSVVFAKGGASFQASNRERVQSALNQLFGAPVKAAPATPAAEATPKVGPSVKDGKPITA